MNHLSPSSSSAYSSKEKNLFFAIFIPLPTKTLIRVFPPQMIPLLFVPLILRIFPNHPMRAAPMRVLHSYSFSFLTYIYHPSRPKFVSKKGESSYFLSSSIPFFLFLNLPSSKAIFPTSNSPPKPSKESPAFLKLQ